MAVEQPSDPTEQLLREEEGYERCVYPDSRGFQTIGIGACVDSRIRGAGLCDAAIQAQYQHDVATASSTAARIPNYGTLNEVQQAALKSICFQLGDQILGWTNFMTAMLNNDVGAAANALMDSKWATKETPERAQRETLMLSGGMWVPK